MTNRITDRKCVTIFRKYGADICKTVEGSKEYTDIKLLQELYIQLLHLLETAPNLPDIFRSDIYNKKPKLKWDKIYKEIQKKLNKYDTYLEIFDPYDFDEKDHVHGSLADDIADIYGDIKAGIENWNNSDAKTRRDIVWSWKNDFEIHWGEHATGALRAIYTLLFHKIDGEDGLPIGLNNQ